jgi:hypothetical protein
LRGWFSFMTIAKCVPALLVSPAGRGWKVISEAPLPPPGVPSTPTGAAPGTSIAR